VEVDLHGCRVDDAKREVLGALGRAARRDGPGSVTFVHGRGRDNDSPLKDEVRRILRAVARKATVDLDFGEAASRPNPGSATLSWGKRGGPRVVAALRDLAGQGAQAAYPDSMDRIRGIAKSDRRGRNR
jgi:hypothetical protein